MSLKRALKNRNSSKRLLSPQERFDIVQAILVGKRKISEVCRQFSVSRFTVHKWLRRAKEGGKLSLNRFRDQRLRGERHWRFVSRVSRKRVLDLVSSHPEFSARKIFDVLPQKDGKPIVSYFTVQKILERERLNTLESRLAWTRKKKVASIPKFALQKRLLSPEERLKLVKKVLIEKKKISEVCRQFGISRFTFYKWVKRAVWTEKLTPDLFCDRRPKGETHWRYIGEAAKNQVLNLVLAHPEFSTKKIFGGLPKQDGRPIVGYFTVQRILEREGLNLLRHRLAWAQSQKEAFAPVPRPVVWLGPILKILRFTIAPFVTVPKIVGRPLPYGLFFASIAGTIFAIYKFLILFTSAPASQKTGYLFAMTALTFGLFFFLYSLKYYLSLLLVLTTSGRTSLPAGREEEESNTSTQGLGLTANIEDVKLERYPFVSIHIPFYNEKRVAERILKATTALEYPNYEVIVADDSTDETTQIVQQFATDNNQQTTDNKGPVVKVIHRETREGFKGGALQKALENTDPRTEYILILDADFIPFPDTITSFLKYFSKLGGGLDNVHQTKVAAVQGYQWHVLNKSENWITRGVRTEYAGSYVVERSGVEVYQGLKMIAGSVYMIRADILRQYGWGRSITEDFQLTLRLYADGYKVVYTPYIQAPSECVSTIRRLVRQRMRWAEGHSFNVKKMFAKLIRSKAMTVKEKLEFLYLAPYYLQATFFMIGTISWFLSEAVFKVHLPFWTQTFGWSLVLTNFLSLPLMNTIGLFLEESEEKDYLGIASFILLSYIVVPFQGYAAVKGLLEKEEGPWFRTPKTGVITDVIGKIQLGFWWRRLFPWGKPATIPVSNQAFSLQFLALSKLNLKPDIYNLRPRRMPFLSKSLLAILLTITLLAGYFSFLIPQTYATNPTDTKWYLRDQEVGYENFDRSLYCVSSTDCKIAYYDLTNGVLKFRDCDDATCSTGTTTVVDSTGDVGDTNSVYCLASDDCKIAYYDYTNGDLKLADCDNSDCSSKTITTVDSTSDVGPFNSIYCLSSTDCKISYYDYEIYDLKFADCDDSACTSRTITTIDSYGDVGEYSSIYCLSSTDCKISYRYYTGRDLRFVDCDDSACTSGNRTITNVDTTGEVGSYTSVYCVETSPGAGDASSNCKISYLDETNADLKFRDCDDATCSTGTTTLLDGNTGCTLTNCSTTSDVGSYTSISCLSATDCKIAYRDYTNGDLRMADCDDATCSTGTTTLLDGNTGCSLTNCSTSTSVGSYSSIYCLSSADCKISYYDGNAYDIKLADCDSATCNSGTTVTFDGNKIINGTLGAVTTTKTFGSSAGETYTLVSDTQYPTGGDSGNLATGTYTLDLHFTNSITSGTLTWHYDVGYCTISSNCTTKTVHVTSADQNFTSATTSPQNITVSAGSPLTIPGPEESKWLYIELHATAVATGTISVRENNTDANTADTYIDVPALTVPEFIGFLVPAAPFLPKIISKVRERMEEKRKKKKLWKLKKS